MELLELLLSKTAHLIKKMIMIFFTGHLSAEDWCVQEENGFVQQHAL